MRIGDRLGPYEVTAKLGEGGMGEVYRATDTQLKREVAIKVLPAEFVADRERLARFEREAQLLAQLNHPNIAHIYGLEKWRNGDRHRFPPPRALKTEARAGNRCLSPFLRWSWSWSRGRRWRRGWSLGLYP